MTYLRNASCRRGGRSPASHSLPIAHAYSSYPGPLYKCTFNAFNGNFRFFEGFFWDARGILWDLMGYFVGFNWIFRLLRDFWAILCDLMGFYQILRDFLGFSGDTMGSNGIFWGIQWDF